MGGVEFFDIFLSMESAVKQISQIFQFEISKCQAETIVRTATGNI